MRMPVFIGRWPAGLEDNRRGGCVKDKRCALHRAGRSHRWEQLSARPGRLPLTGMRGGRNGRRRGRVLEAEQTAALGSGTWICPRQYRCHHRPLTPTLSPHAGEREQHPSDAAMGRATRSRVPARSSTSPCTTDGAKNTNAPAVGPGRGLGDRWQWIPRIPATRPRRERPACSGRARACAACARACRFRRPLAWALPVVPGRSPPALAGRRIHPA